MLRWSERLSYRLADAVIAMQRVLPPARPHARGVAADRVFVVRNGPREGWPRRGRRPTPSLKRGRPLLVVYMGVMGYQDGVDVLLDAVHTLVHDDGVPRRDLRPRRRRQRARRPKRQARELGIEEFVDFVGWVADEELLVALPRDRRRLRVPRALEPAERPLDLHQGHGVHGLGHADRRLRPARDAVLGGRRRRLRRARRRRGLRRAPRGGAHRPRAQVGDAAPRPHGACRRCAGSARSRTCWRPTGAPSRDTTGRSRIREETPARERAAVSGPGEVRSDL